MFSGAYVLGSVFKPNQLRLKNAKGLRFYLEQGTEDRITAIRFAREASETLTKKKASVKLVEYKGGHGFTMPDAEASLRNALEWLKAR